MKVQLLKKVENIVAKGENTCFEQFLNLLQCFQKLSAAEASKNVHMLETVKVARWNTKIMAP